MKLFLRDTILCSLILVIILGFVCTDHSNNRVENIVEANYDAIEEEISNSDFDDTFVTLAQ